MHVAPAPDAAPDIAPDAAPSIGQHDPVLALPADDEDEHAAWLGCESAQPHMGLGSPQADL